MIFYAVGTKVCLRIHLKHSNVMKELMITMLYANMGTYAFTNLELNTTGAENQHTSCYQGGEIYSNQVALELVAVL